MTKLLKITKRIINNYRKIRALLRFEAMYSDMDGVIHYTRNFRQDEYLVIPLAFLQSDYVEKKHERPKESKAPHEIKFEGDWILSQDAWSQERALDQLMYWREKYPNVILTDTDGKFQI